MRNVEYRKREVVETQYFASKQENAKHSTLNSEEKEQEKEDGSVCLTRPISPIIL